MLRHLLIILSVAWAKTWKNKVGRNTLIHVLAAGRTNGLCTIPSGIAGCCCSSQARRHACTVVCDGELDQGSDETIAV
jgi:hypothetical protein